MNEKNPSIVALALTAFLALSTFWAGVRMEFPATVKAASAPITYVKTYANFVHGTTQQKDLTPEGVQATSDGGYILLASTLCITQACVTAQGNSNPVVNWIVKTDSSGNPQWQKELGCFKAPGGDYTIGVVIQQALDGGYIVGGGALNDGANCGAGGTQQRAIVEKLDSGGNVVWAKSYSTGAIGEGITAIKPTTDGGFVAAGGVYDVGPSPGGGMVLKLDSAGVVQWQTVVGPTASTTAWLLAIQQTSDGGYVSTGNYYVSSSQCQPLNVRAVWWSKSTQPARSSGSRRSIPALQARCPPIPLFRHPTTVLSLRAPGLEPVKRAVCWLSWIRAGTSFGRMPTAVGVT